MRKSQRWYIDHSIPICRGSRARIYLHLVHAVLIPVIIQINKDGNDFGFAVGMDRSVFFPYEAAHGIHGRTTGEIDIEFLFDRFAEIRPLQFVKQITEFATHEVAGGNFAKTGAKVMLSVYCKVGSKTAKSDQSVTLGA